MSTILPNFNAHQGYPLYSIHVGKMQILLLPSYANRKQAKIITILILAWFSGKGRHALR